eukprot:1580527-Prymnesium_polylepis.1
MMRAPGRNPLRLPHCPPLGRKTRLHCTVRPWGVNPYKSRTIMKHALVAHQPPPARSEPHG